MTTTISEDRIAVRRITAQIPAADDER